MKKLLIFITLMLTLAFMVFPAGCDDSGQGGENPNPEPDTPTYTITFVVNSETVSTTTYKESDGIFELPPFEKVGYNVLGWYDGNATEVTQIDASVKTDITLYAIATPITYRISFNANGGSGTMDSITATYDHPETLPQNTFTHSQRNFVGWALSSNGNKVYSDKDAVLNLTSSENAEIVLYAIWKNTSIVLPPISG